MRWRCTVASWTLYSPTRRLTIASSPSPWSWRYRAATMALSIAPLTTSACSLPASVRSPRQTASAIAMYEPRLRSQCRCACPASVADRSSDSALAIEIADGGWDRSPERLHVPPHVRRVVDRRGGAAVLPVADHGHFGDADRPDLRAPRTRFRGLPAQASRRLRRAGE